MSAAWKFTWKQVDDDDGGSEKVADSEKRTTTKKWSESLEESNMRFVLIAIYLILIMPITGSWW